MDGIYKKNDILKMSIEDMGSDGEGIGKVDGFTVFVKDAIIGDTITAKIMKVKKNYAYARLEKVLNPSPFRVEPECKYYRQCGGCQMQALSYEKQLEYKQNKIRNHLVRIGGFDEAFIESVTEPIVGMDNPYHYRNKAQYPVSTDRDGKVITGFYAGRTHDIIANTDCILGAEENREILETILSYMRENQVSAYDEKTGQGLVRHILIRTGFSSREIMVCLVINGKDIPYRENLIGKLHGIPGMTSISYSINMENTNVIMGKEIHTIWGKETISDTIQNLYFCISPLSFYQVNPLQTEKLYSLAEEYAGLTGRETVWDLYCGIGTISLFLSRKARKVYGVEVIPQAVADARQNARNNGIDNVEFFEGRAEEVLPDFYEKAVNSVGNAGDDEMLHPDVIVVDPPRKGCDSDCIDTMLKMRPDRIVYVSCDSATLARDLKLLCAGGYEIRRVRGVDQFGQTVHVETVVLMSRVEGK